MEGGNRVGDDFDHSILGAYEKLSAMRMSKLLAGAATVSMLQHLLVIPGPSTRLGPSDVSGSRPDASIHRGQ